MLADTNMKKTDRGRESSVGKGQRCNTERIGFLFGKNVRQVLVTDGYTTTKLNSTEHKLLKWLKTVNSVTHIFANMFKPCSGDTCP